MAMSKMHAAGAKIKQKSNTTNMRAYLKWSLILLFVCIVSC